ncbi:sterol desaturase family protein [Paraglaciecola sp.]|uniref:sterol desaturase family protein n=1 Tax=Paraglaciecola sp. TaxID=1920173 RepID=UPI003264CF9D
MVELLSESILLLPGYLVDANKRIFGLYLLSTLFFAVPVFLLKNRPFKFMAFTGYVFNKKIWLHPSARLDYSLFIVNRFLKLILWAPIVLTMVPIAIGFSGAIENVFGEIKPITNNQVVIVSVFTFILFIFDDFTRFLLHFLLHKVPILWDFHKVHHSAIVMTPMTIYRSHPFESYLYACRMALSQGLAVGIGYYLFGPTLSMFDVLGANVFVFVFNLMGSNLRHSHIWWSWGDKVEAWFISPAQHQIHHSDKTEHFDRNLGSALAIWDRGCGTLIKSSETGKIRFGIGNQESGHKSLLEAYISPFKDIWKRRKADSDY